MIKQAPIRTSHTHPLRIDSIQLNEIPALTGMKGCIGMTFCPGQKYTGLFSGEWHRNLATDLKAIESWGANIWLNTMELRDLHKVQLDPVILETSVSSSNITYYHLPILDGSIPCSKTDQRWREFMSPTLKRHLNNGEKLLIHCRAGLGRTGMVAARLLVELGCSPQDAINRVRLIRMGAIQNSLQEAWVHQGPTC